jgi:Ca2+/Na+ antiporter
MFQVHGGGRFSGEILLVGGVVLQYIATRFSMAVVGRTDGSAPGRLAVAQWLPILATAIAAVAMRMPEMAICLVFGSSVASLSLVLGMTSYVAPVSPPMPERRLWAMVLPAAIFLLLAGFRGKFTWLHAVMLLVMGAAFLAVWAERPDPLTMPPESRDERPAALGFLIPAILLAALGAAVTIYGTFRSGSRVLTPDLLAATILSPLLLLPTLGSGTMLAQNGHTDRAVTALSGTVLLNLCLLLPAIILIEYAIGWHHGQAQPVPFPLITWRLDSVLLVVLGFALMPLAFGRWIPERIESVLLIIVYAAYLISETALSAKLLG